MKNLEYRDEVYLKTLMDNVSGAIIRTDKNYKIKVWNKVAEEIYGYSSDEVLGSSYFSLLKNNAEDAIAFKNETNQMNEALTAEVLHHNKNGNEINIVSTAIFLKNESGEVNEVLFFNKNITERKKAADEAWLFATLVEQTSDAVIFTDLNFVIQTWNKGAENLYGYSLPEVIGKTTGEVLQTIITSEERKQILESVNKNGHWKGEKRQKNKNGDTLHVLSSISLIRNVFGEPIGMVGINTDITSQYIEKSQIEEFNKGLKKKVHEQNQELQFVFERISDAFIALDANWNYIYLNEKAGELHGRVPADLIGKNIWDEFPQTRNEPFYNALHEAMASQKPMNVQLFSESTGRWYEDHIYPSPDGISSYYRDITAQKREEDERLKITERVRSILDQAFVGCIVFAFDWTYLYVNKIAASYGESTPENLIGKSFLDIYPRVVNSKIFSWLDQCMKDRKPLHAEFDYTFKDNSVRWYEVSVEPVDEGIFILSNEITESKKVERESQMLAEQLREISSSVPGAVYQFVLTTQGEMKFTFVSDGIEQLTGLKKEVCYVDALAAFSLVTPDYIEELFQTISESASTLLPWIYVFQIRDKQGVLKWIRGNSIPRKSENGDVVWNGTFADITELKNVEAELKASELRYRTLIEHASDLIFILDEDGVITDLNPIACNRLGFDHKDVVGKSIGTFIVSDVFLYQQINAEHLSKGQSVLSEIKMLCKSKEIVELESNIKLLPDGRILVIGRDLTERKIAEAKRLKSERRYRLLFERNLAGVYRTTVSGKILECNEAAAKMLGYNSVAELLALNTDALYFDKAEREKYLKLLRVNNALTNYQSKLKRKDGSSLYLIENISLSNDLEIGEEVIEGIAIDITDNVKANEELQDSKNQFQSLVENISGIYWVSDLLQMQTLYITPSYETIWGGKCEDLYEDTLDFLKPVHPDDYQDVYDFYKSLNETRNASITFRIIRPDGAIRWIESRVNVQENSKGEKYSYGYAEDITERKTADEAIRQSEQKYKLMFKKNPMPMWMASALDMKFISANEAAIEFYGYSNEEFLKMSTTDLLAQTSENEMDNTSRIRTGSKNSMTHVVAHKKRNGDVVQVEIKEHKIEYKGKPAFLILANDVTEKLIAEQMMKQSNLELRELSSHLETIREEERTTISREIHDELGQQLTGLKMDASWLSRKIPQKETVLQEKITTMISLIEDTVKSVRRISSDLRPGILDDLGLIDALDWASVEFERRTGIECKFKPPVEEVSFEKNLSTGIFRVYQEALTNVARHAGASRIKTTFDKSSDNWILVIEDDGMGFDSSDVISKKTLGLVGMKERAKMFGGKLNIASKAGVGTVVRLEVPLKEEN